MVPHRLQMRRNSLTIQALTVAYYGTYPRRNEQRLPRPNPGLPNPVVWQACRPIAKRARPEKNSLAKGRMGAYLGETNEAAAAVLSQDVCKRLGRKLQMPVLLPGDFPVELRMYPKGSYMDWHVDEVMYR